MTKQFVNGNVLLHRSDILDGLRALHLAQIKFEHLSREDSYSCGFRDGFEDALISVAQLVGVIDEFRTLIAESRETNNINRIPALTDTANSINQTR